MHAVQQLLQQVSDIRKKYYEFAKLNGENFNIFRILRLESSEVRTHSRFIGELLNPGGSHGQGELFLQLFLQEMHLENFATEDIQLEIEYKVGVIDSEFMSGGNIDLVLWNRKGQCIIIENKIYAGDQLNQLMRYHAFGSKKYPGACNIFYLTLDGKDPTGYSTGQTLSKNEDFTCIAYDTHMLRWLEACRKESTTCPVLRETLTQYINLIKILTNQTTNTNMSKEIKNAILSSSENYESAWAVYDLLKGIEIEIFEEMGEEIDRQLTAMYAQRNSYYLGKYRIDFFSDRQSYDYYFGFKAHLLNDDEEVDNRIDELKPLVQELNKINRRFRSERTMIGTYLLPLGNFWQDKKLQFKLTNAADLQEFVRQMLVDAFSDIEAFRKTDLLNTDIPAQNLQQ